MKKVLLSLLVAASAAFGFQDIETFAGKYKPQTNNLYLGTIQDSNKRNVGIANCKNGKYTITYNVINFNTKYVGKKDIVYDNDTLDKWCSKVNDPSTEMLGGNYENVSKTYYKDRGVYNFCYQEKVIYKYHDPDSIHNDKTSNIYATIQTCPTAPSPLDALAKPLEIPTTYGTLSDEKSEAILKTINEWNIANGHADALWIDQGENIFRPTREEYQGILNNASAGGLIFDNEYGWYAEVWGNKDGTMGYITTNGNPEYRKMKNSDLTWAIEADSTGRANEYRYEKKYYYDCIQTNSGRGDNKFYGAVVATIYDRKDGVETQPVMIYPAPNSDASFTCNNSMKGAFLDYKEFWAYANAGKALMRPVYIKK